MIRRYFGTNMSQLEGMKQGEGVYRNAGDGLARKMGVRKACQRLRARIKSNPRKICDISRAPYRLARNAAIDRSPENNGPPASIVYSVYSLPGIRTPNHPRPSSFEKRYKTLHPEYLPSFSASNCCPLKSLCK